MASDTDGVPASPSYSTAEVARRLGVSIPTVQRWVDQGHLRAWKTVGGHRRVDAASVEVFVRSRGLQAPGPSSADRPPARVSVLVVDDNVDDRDLLTVLVEAAIPGAVVSLADNGFEGLISIGTTVPDVLVTDIVMPNMNGVEMLRHVDARGTGRPKVMIAVSSRRPPGFAGLGELPEGVSFVAKPLEPEVFITTLRTALAAAAGTTAEVPPGAG